MEDFVTYEQAVILKELGFDCDCSYYYEKGILTPAFEEITIKSNHIYPFDATWRVSVDSLSGNYNFTNGIFSAPTLAQAAKYLREEIGADLVVSPRFNSKTGDRIGYFWRWSQRTDVNDNKTYKTFERALSAGISKVLEPFKEYFYVSKSGFINSLNNPY